MCVNKNFTKNNNNKKQSALRRCVRIHSVQKVIHNPTQLSGRGFSHIFYMRSILSQFYVFLMLQNGRRAEKKLAS